MVQVKAVWQTLEKHGLKGEYCPHCDQRAIANELLRLDAEITNLKNAMEEVEE